MQDLYADGNKPTAKNFGNMYRVQGPVKEVYAYVLVNEDDLAELWDWRYFDKKDPHKGGYRLSDPKDKELWDAKQEVWVWLQEWDLIEKKQIGPEDSEYFATERLSDQ